MIETFMVNFSDWSTTVLLKNKVGYIEKTGKMLIKPLFDRCWGTLNFNGGLAAVELNGKNGLY